MSKKSSISTPVTVSLKETPTLPTVELRGLGEIVAKVAVGGVVSLTQVSEPPWLSAFPAASAIPDPALVSVNA